MSKQNRLISFWTIIAILTLPPLLIGIGVDVDYSWKIALHMAVKKTLQFGKDFVFTYGPLGFLMFPLFIYEDLWTISLFFHIAIHFIFIFLIAHSLNKFKANLRQYAITTIVLFLILPFYPDYMDYKIIYSATIALYMALTCQYSEKQRLILTSVSIILLAIVSIIKFSSFILSFILISSVCIVLIFRGNFFRTLSIFSLYLISLLFLWIFSGQNISNIPLYISNSIEISSGYNTAMGRPGPIYDALISVSSLLFIFYIGIKKFYAKKYNLSLFIFFNLGLIFFSFKHGFVRNDNAHNSLFFITLMYYLSFLYVSNKEELSNLSRNIVLLFFFISVIILLIKAPNLPNPIHNLSMIKEYVSLLSNKEYREHFRNGEKKKMGPMFSLLEYSPLESTINSVGGKTVDIFTSDIALAYAYDLNWTPRPIPQSYSAYTSKLDNLNSDFFESNNSPEIILYTPVSIDHKFPLFDEPATFRTLLKNYQPLFNDGNYIFLKKKNSKIVSSETHVLTKTARIGDSISIPEVLKEEFLFARVYMDYNTLGKIVSLFYKPPMAYIQFSDTYGEFSTKYRFIHKNASNGIVLSPYVYSLKDLFNLWKGFSEKINVLKKLIISTENSYLYNNEIKIEFFKVKFN